MNIQKHLVKICGKIPNTNRTVEIPINKKNMIVTGPNGSGKTSFLREMHRKLNLLIRERKLADLPNLKQQLINNENYLKSQDPGTSNHQNTKTYIIHLQNQINDIESGLNFEIENPDAFSKELDDRIAIISFFEANRSAQISHADTAKGIESEREQIKNTQTGKLGKNLEQHLVNLKNRRSLALSEDNDTVLAKDISDWLEHFERNLKELMEDPSTQLSFNTGTLKFTINQEGKPPYTFQSLSSGYLAIFDIYADLLMQSEYFTTPPDKLTGVIFIDEIDAHLHVSLQRLILPFFEKSFPNIQFIVSTHSPFVLTSVQDSVIFDLGRNQAVEEDLSFYPYSSVMEGLLSTKTTSIVLEEAIRDLTNIINHAPEETQKLKELLEKIKPFEEKLDNRSKAFYLQGVNSLLDKE